MSFLDASYVDISAFLTDVNDTRTAKLIPLLLSKFVIDPAHNSLLSCLQAYRVFKRKFKIWAIAVDGGGGAGTWIVSALIQLHRIGLNLAFEIYNTCQKSWNTVPDCTLFCDFHLSPSEHCLLLSELQKVLDLPPNQDSKVLSFSFQSFVKTKKRSFFISRTVFIYPFHNISESLHVLEITDCSLERNSKRGSQTQSKF